MPSNLDFFGPVWDFGQHWLPHNSPAFAPGRVALGLMGNKLIIRAELSAAKVMREVFPFNFPAFMQCDVFEIFLGPTNEKTYYEFHVTPSNSALQLRFEGDGEAKPIEDLTVAEPLFTSQTTLFPGGWTVSARIPLDGLFPTTHPVWLLSFGRYDYTPGQHKPVISSTSPHAVCNFHRREEWRQVRLADLPESFGAVPRFMGVK